MAMVCGSVSFPAGTAYSMTLSNFAPNPNGAGGSITILLNGQVVATWDATDSKGNLVPNSYYHFILQEHASDGSTVLLERDAFIAPYHNEPVSLSAIPNVGRPGGTISFTASFAGTPADSQSKIRLYAVSGELVQSLTLSNGVVTWDLTNMNYQPVASGVYLAVLTGIDPTNGQKLYKISKILVTH